MAFCSDVRRGLRVSSFCLSRVRRASPGPIRSTSTSGRSASTPSPTGLATCLWSTLSFAWTPSSSKIKCLSFARNTKTWRGRESDWGTWEVWASGLSDRQLDRSLVCSQDVELKDCLGCGEDGLHHGQSSGRPRWTALEYIRLEVKGL